MSPAVSGQHPSISLFDMVSEIPDLNTESILCSKPTLVHISHTLEDMVLKNQLPALMFTGFQESSHWQQEVKRYEELSETALQVCIFAGRPLPPDTGASVVHVELEGDDPLRQEWFVMIMCSRFGVLLCGKDQSVSGVPESERVFETILSFDPQVIEPVLDRLEAVLAHYRPDALPTLREGRTQFADLQPDMSLISHILTRLVSYEERLANWLRETNREQAETLETLRQERDFIRNLVEALPIYFFVLDADGQVQIINAMLRETLHLAAEVAPDEQDWRAWLHPDDVAVAQAAFDRVLADGETTVFQARLLVDDRTIMTEWYAGSTGNAAGDVTLLFAPGLDITARLEAEKLRLEDEALRIELEKEQAFNRVRQQLMETISHEFNTPLTTIQTSTLMLERYFDRLTPEKRQERLTHIQRQTDRLIELLEDITTLVSLTRGTVTRRADAIDLVAHCRDVLDEISKIHEPEREIRYQPDQPTFSIRGDIQLLQLILSNLVSNALKYSPQDTPVTVTLQTHEDTFSLIIRDMGPGLPTSDREQLFQTFSRGSNVNAIGGIGLGLKIVQESVRIYGGDMDYHSTRQDGTTFIVTLPLLKE